MTTTIRVLERMQRSKTVDFWNQLHYDDEEEWIVHPSESLLAVLTSLRATRVLEIGCGTSRLASTIVQHCSYCRVMATDVSPVCIDRNRERDASLMQRTSGRLDYMVWDVLEDDVDILGVEPTFDMVLDKGCLDTFLFRSERKLHEALVQRLLGRVYSLTRRYYVVVTPRSKIKPLRDYEGFSVQERRVLRDDLGALQSSDSKKEEAYLFICVKNFRYIPEQEPITEDDKELSGTCDQCGISYVDFCKSSPSGKESRRWRNHRLHCKGDNCVNVMS